MDTRDGWLPRHVDAPLPPVRSLGHRYDASVSGSRPGELRQRNCSGSINETEERQVSPTRVKEQKIPAAVYPIGKRVATRSHLQDTVASQFDGAVWLRRLPSARNLRQVQTGPRKTQPRTWMGMATRRGPLSLSVRPLLSPSNPARHARTTALPCPHGAYNKTQQLMQPLLPRRRHHRLHDGLLPDAPSQLRPRLAHHHPPRGHRHCRWRLGQGRRTSGAMGLPELPRPVVVPPAQGARRRAQRRRTMGVPSSRMRQPVRHRQAERP